MSDPAADIGTLRSGDAPTAETQIANMLSAVLLTDRELSIREANPAAEELLMQSRGRLRGMAIATACGIADHVIERLAREDARIVARGVTIMPAGKARTVDLTVSPITHMHGWRIVTLLEVGQDHMREGDRGNMALQGPAILAHEIKNPLAAIKGASQLLAKRAGRDNAQFIAIITDQVEQIAGLVDRMQALGRGYAEPTAPINPHPFIRRAVATIKTSTNATFAIDEQFDPSIPEMEASPESILQILTNLLANAADAVGTNPQGLIIVRTRYVSGLAVKPENGADVKPLPIEIAICDNGGGIDAQIIDTLFEPFVTTRKEGQGLGLPLVRKLMHDMGGRITHLRDDVTGMTEFRLHLPTARAPR